MKQGIVAAMLSLAVSGIGPVAAAQPAAAVPTFTKDVAPIVFAKCVRCHRPGEIAPMSLLTYENARPWARAMKDKVIAREMPPWFVDRNDSLPLRDDPSLTDREIATIAAWSDGGAPKGRDADLPSMPKFVEGWGDATGQSPDAVLELPVLFQMPAEGEVDIQDFYSPIPWNDTRFAEALEMRPTNRGITHHARIDLVELPKDARIVEGRAIGADGRALTREQVTRTTNAFGTNPDKVISFVPGRGYERFDSGTGKSLPGGKHLKWSMHWQASGKPETDQSKLGVWFSRVPVHHELVNRSVGSPLIGSPSSVESPPDGGPRRREMNLIAEGQPVPPEISSRSGEGYAPNIPAYADNWKMVGISAVTEDITLYQLSPHFHLRGKHVKWAVTYPDGRTQSIISAKYDFNWQMDYHLEQPLKIPAGSKLTAVVHFDNSLKNPYNPAPEKEVYWSEQSWDEMWSPFVDFTIDSQNLSKITRAVQQH